jgi:uncharacterized protein YndB with AHSA1/START domain
MTEATDVQSSPINDNVFSKTTVINASTSKVWAALTDTDLMKKWMSESDIQIITDWVVGNPMIIRGKLHGVKFENKGTVLTFKPEKILQYSHSSSLSRLPDTPESYCVIEFRLEPVDDQTRLTVAVSNFPNEIIYKHMAFYWNVTPEILRRMIEKQE